MIQTLDVPCEFKFATGGKPGFAGYCAVFGNLDSGQDVIRADAVKEIVKTRDNRLLVLNAHNSTEPIGKAIAKIDSTGVHIDAELMADDPIAMRVYRLMKNNLLDALSIGFNLLENGATYKSDRRVLTAISIMEASVCAFGMNTLARIDSVKSTALDCQNVRQLEELLRDRLMIGQRKAAACANAMFKILNSGQADETETLAAEIEKAIGYTVMP